MQSSVFVYTVKGLCVSSFTGTGTEFNNVSAGLANVWQMVSMELVGASQELANIMYISSTGTLIATLSNGYSHSICGARFHGEISAYDSAVQLIDKIRQVAG